MKKRELIIILLSIAALTYCYTAKADYTVVTSGRARIFKDIKSMVLFVEKNRASQVFKSKPIKVVIHEVK